MESKTEILITKADGSKEAFVPEKLYQSLVRSGAEPEVAERITSGIASTLVDGERTRDIYKDAFSRLRKIERPVAARYSVKRALLELGPSGYPFEDFLAEIYHIKGFETSNRRIIQGRCVEHELDMIAQKGGERIGAEMKFHNNHGLKSDVKVALYVHARFEDIKAGAELESEHDYTNRMLITNTKFTEQAQLFGECVGLTLLSWDYPHKGNLRELIEETGVHPVSCITTLSRVNKRKLMDSGVVLCRQLHDNVPALESLGLSSRDLDALFAEVDHLCR